ncbi:MAG: tetratricopeptide repeat protein [Planctomycetaceae bacterium]|nr:tetratricopeptide repeat protein [Planctomycetaceae bacterium]MBV8268416.1 tetratricopeptide repeat protein [Planctomycetaceae bacterium]
MHRLGVIVFAAVLVMVPRLSRAQTGDSWLGKRVITRYGAVLRVGTQVVDDEDRGKNLARRKERNTFRVYRVERTKDGWLWLVAEQGGARGWVRTEWVIALDQAVDYCTNRIRANSGVASHYLHRGSVWDAKGEYDIALADYNEAIRLDPNLAVAYYDRGNVWFDMQEYDKALADYNEAIRLDPNLAVAYTNRGVAWGHKQEYDKALADYNEAIRLDPQDTSAHNGRAWVWATSPEEKYRDGKRAVESATRGCELSGWKEANHLGTLAAAYAEVGDFAKAVEWQTKAIELLKDEKGKDDYRARLKLYQEKKPYRVAVPAE